MQGPVRASSRSVIADELLLAHSSNGISSSILQVLYVPMQGPEGTASENVIAIANRHTH